MQESSISRPRAMIWMMLWALFFSSAMTLAKKLDAHIPSASLIFIRSIFGILFLTPFMLRQGVKPLVHSNKYTLHMLRAMITCAAMGCTYYAYRHLPMAYAASIGQSGPLFTAILSILFLKERISMQKWLALLGGYLGVLIMLFPIDTHINVASIAAILANILAGCAVITAKMLTKTESSEQIMLFSTSVVLIVTGILSIWYSYIPTYEEIFLLALLGAFGVLSQLSYLQALRHERASFVSGFEYIRLCVSIPIGYLVFNEVPAMSVLFGSLVIVGALMMLSKDENPALSSPAQSK